ncbi:MAG: PAS domain S-box protein, partial [Alphaproteobacteria bacterium]|nr:PAS domain S-box protein [Alphaproteobacteria bacterium]
ELERRAQEADARLVQAVEALDDGFVLTDPDDRIVVGNRNFRRLNAEVAEQVQPGRLFIDHLRQRIALGLIPDAVGDPEAWLRKRMASRRNPAGAHSIRRRFDGTWLLVKDQRLPDGSTITVLVDITEQKRREIALQESEERYALAVAGVRDGIWDWLIDEKRLFVSARSAEILGQPQGEGWRHSDSFSDFLDPGERSRYAEALRAHLSGAAGHFAFEGRFVRADGSPLWGLIRGLSKRDASGRAVRMSGSLTDVTERRERDAQLERQREQLLDAQRLARLGYFTFDRATGASVWSETMAEIMGTKAAELRTSFDAFLSHLHIDDRQLYVRLRQDCFARREPVRAELRVVRPGAETRWIDIQTRPLFDATGALVGSHGVVFDITDRMAAAEALRRTNEDLERLVSERTRHLEAEITERRYAQAALTESEQRLKDIVAASSDWFWELDAELRVTSFSDVFYRTTGASPDATVGRHYAEWAPPADAAASMRSQWALLARAIESRQPFRNVAYQLRAADGGTLHVRLGGVPVLHDGKFAGMRGSGTDVTELKDAQDALMQAEKMSSIATMVAGISHEINTPIGVAVTGSSHLSEHVRTFVASYRSGPLKRTTLDALLLDLDEGLRIIGSNLRRAADLVQSFKQVSVDQVSGISRVIDLALYLREIVGTLSPQLRGSGITVAIECPDGVLLTTYPGAISQIVTNLVMNSLVHAFEPGASGQLTLAVSAGERDVEIVYADDGSGVSEDVLQRMFEPFFTTRRGRGGSGLGLSIVYNLVTQKLGGEIRAEGAPGKGLRFTIRLPRKAPVAADALT